MEASTGHLGADNLQARAEPDDIAAGAGSRTDDFETGAERLMQQRPRDCGDIQGAGWFWVTQKKHPSEICHVTVKLLILPPKIQLASQETLPEILLPPP